MSSTTSTQPTGQTKFSKRVLALLKTKSSNPIADTLKDVGASGSISLASSRSLSFRQLSFGSEGTSSSAVSRTSASAQTSQRCPGSPLIRRLSVAPSGIVNLNKIDAIQLPQTSSDLNGDFLEPTQPSIVLITKTSSTNATEAEQAESARPLTTANVSTSSTSKPSRLSSIFKNSLSGFAGAKSKRKSSSGAPPCTAPSEASDRSSQLPQSRQPDAPQRASLGSIVDEEAEQAPTSATDKSDEAKQGLTLSSPSQEPSVRSEASTLLAPSTPDVPINIGISTATSCKTESRTTPFSPPNELVRTSSMASSCPQAPKRVKRKSVPMVDLQTAEVTGSLHPCPRGPPSVVQRRPQRGVSSTNSVPQETAIEAQRQWQANLAEISAAMQTESSSSP